MSHGMKTFKCGLSANTQPGFRSVPLDIKPIILLYMIQHQDLKDLEKCSGKLDGFKLVFENTILQNIHCGFAGL